MIAAEAGMSGTTIRFIKTYKSGRRVSVIMTDEGVLSLGGEVAAKNALEGDWKGIIRKFNLLVEVE